MRVTGQQSGRDSSDEVSARSVEGHHPAKEVLVIGGGVAGIATSLELAEAGFRVLLCDRSPSIGGALAQMDKWFPDGHCSLCQLLPAFDPNGCSLSCLRSGFSHPSVETLPLTEVVDVQGEAGNFTATLRTQPRGVDPERCTGCGLCVQACPIEVPDEFEMGRSSRKAIYLRHPLLPPNQYAIDWDTCTRCGACVQACPTKAIDLSQQETARKVRVGAIVLAAGFESFDPKPLTQYGYGRYPNVVTNLELERMLSPSGPAAGVLRRPSDGQTPRSVAFIQCAGSRDVHSRGYCSSACCMYALKEATLLKQAYPDMDVKVFFMDMRAFGKGYHRYYQEAESRWSVGFTRCRVPVVEQDFHTSELVITAPSEDGTIDARRFDMVVLSTGQAPPPGFRELCSHLGVETDRWGFCKTAPFSPVETRRKGVYVCGSASGPKDIADTICEAGACAAQVMQLLGTPVAEQVPSEKPYALQDDEEPRIAVLMCRCTDPAWDVLDMVTLVSSMEALPGVATAEVILGLCQQKDMDALRQAVSESQANRAVIAACSRLLNSDLSRLAREAGLDPTFVQSVDLREQIAWVHTDLPMATRKAISLLGMAVERVRLQQPSHPAPMPIRPSALVVGGGLAGLTAALHIARQGIETHLVERTCELGGNLRHVYGALEGADPQALLSGLLEQAGACPQLHVHTEAEVAHIEGYAGNYEVTLNGVGAQGVAPTLNVGAVIVATGGQESRPTEYLYGQCPNAITQSELERRLSHGEVDAASLKSVVMIQCVGSRDEQRPYCSRICCSQALKNALALKERNPDVQVFILYRDLMSYGLNEEYYTFARQRGVLFVRYEPNRKPQVTLEGDKLRVRVREPALGQDVVLEPDLLVLSPAIVPADVSSLARMLDMELDSNGFVCEAEEKFRPVDTLRDGVFVCGLAHSPRSVRETAAHAQAAAQRAVSLMRRQSVRSGRVVAEINTRRCSGCEACIPVCPYGARIRDEELSVVVVREALCRGCGACVQACPNGAAQLQGFSQRQVFAMMDMM